MLLKPLYPRQIKTSIPFWAWPNLLSLDAVLVAVIWQWFFAKSFNLTLSRPEEFILALTVWLIYVFDRLFDALKLDLSKEHSLRHSFYYRHYFEFAAVAVLFLSLDVYLVVSGLQFLTVVFGLSLFALVLLYGLGLHLFAYARAYKEIYIGLIFSLGVSLVYLKDLNPALLLGIILFAALAALNCLLISSWEQSQDLAQNYNSRLFARAIEPGQIRALLAVFVAIALLVFVAGANYFYLAISLSFILLLFLDFGRDALSSLSLRILVDLALFSPLLLVFF